MQPLGDGGPYRGMEIDRSAMNADPTHASCVLVESLPRLLVRAATNAPGRSSAEARAWKILGRCKWSDGTGVKNNMCIPHQDLFSSTGED